MRSSAESRKLESPTIDRNFARVLDDIIEIKIEEQAKKSKVAAQAVSCISGIFRLLFVKCLSIHYRKLRNVMEKLKKRSWAEPFKIKTVELLKMTTREERI
jgi:hypothetical protein